MSMMTFQKAVVLISLSLPAPAVHLSRLQLNHVWHTCSSKDGVARQAITYTRGWLQEEDAHVVAARQPCVYDEKLEVVGSGLPPLSGHTSHNSDQIDCQNGGVGALLGTLDCGNNIRFPGDQPVYLFLSGVQGDKKIDVQEQCDSPLSLGLANLDRTKQGDSRYLQLAVVQFSECDGSKCTLFLQKKNGEQLEVTITQGSGPVTITQEYLCPQTMDWVADAMNQKLREFKASMPKIS